MNTHSFFHVLSLPFVYAVVNENIIYTIFMKCIHKNKAELKNPALF